MSTSSSQPHRLDRAASAPTPKPPQAWWLSTPFQQPEVRPETAEERRERQARARTHNQ